MNDDLQERLGAVEIEVCDGEECSDDWALGWQNAAKVLAEIESAGYVLVERGEWGEWEPVRTALATANAFLLARASRSERGG